MKNIQEIARDLGLTEDHMICYGHDVLKITGGFTEKENSNLILVTAINPTPYGEGKTTVSIGLHDAFCKLGKKSMAVLREPSLGPVFGLKGGATGGGKAQLIPSEKINLHFTGDFHAITSANNLLCAALDNHIYQGNQLDIDPNQICIKRAMDMNDRSLRDQFHITAASEVMAIFCLANSLSDLRNRLANILVAYSKSGEAIYARDLKVDGAMAMLLLDAFNPNLVQTLEENPVLVHGGPFANIAHGCSSVVATKLGLCLCDYVVTEAGFGSDLGGEKFLDITARIGKFRPKMIVLVATVRALKHSGLDNLQAHIDHLNNYNIPFCVTINHFFDDKKEDIDEIIDYCEKQGIVCILSDAFHQGSEGCLDLAKTVIDMTNDAKERYQPLYPFNMDVRDKFQILASKVYHAKTVVYSDKALAQLDKIEQLGIGHYPICVSKTPFSISDDPNKLGYPKDYLITVQDIIVQTGSRMIVFLLNKVILMPGLPKNPQYENYESEFAE
ncbi:MAG: formate--tetrahydrofolate ligase [bacterium]|nr:formate--tetrahydrofolate ligase [bacterium]